MTLFLFFLTRFMKHFEDLADAKEEKFGNPGVYSEIFASKSWIWGIQLSRNCSTWMLRPMWSQTFRRHQKKAPTTNVTWRPRQDWTSLEKVGILRKGTLHPRTECAQKIKKVNRFKEHSRWRFYQPFFEKTKMKFGEVKDKWSKRYYANWCQLVLAVVEIVVTKIKAKRRWKKRHGVFSWCFDLQPRLTEPRKRLQSLTRQKKCCESRPWQLASSFDVFLPEIWPSTSTASKTVAR